MGALDDVVSVTITANTAAPSKEGFGTPLIAAYHTIAGPLVRTYKKPSEMLTDGFTVNHQAYKKAVALCSQPNKVKTFKVGKCLGAPAQTMTLRLISSATGVTHSVTVTLPDGSSSTVTVTGTGVVNTDAASLATALNALASSSASSSTDTVTFTTTAAGDVIVISEWSSLLEVKDTTANPATSIATDLASIAAADNDWYGLILAVPSEAIVNAAASWANSNKKLLVYVTSDTLCTDAGTTTDVASDVKGNSYDHVAGIFCGKTLPGVSDAAWMGYNFPYKPGDRTWQFKTLTGVTVDTALTTAQKTALAGKNLSYYVTLAGINCTQGGAKTAKGEFIDVIHFLDWQVAEIQYRIFSAMINNSKIPFTDPGIDTIVSAVTGAIEAGISAGGISNNPRPVVSAPAAKEVSAADKATRNLPDVTFTFTLSGAIHTAEVEGTVSV